jgi:hypothetical protein
VTIKEQNASDVQSLGNQFVQDTLPLLRIGNKTPTEGVTETKFGAETKGWTIYITLDFNSILSVFIHLG